MTNIFILNTSASGDASVSNRLTAEFAAQLRERAPDAQITVRDIGAKPIPHLLPETIAGIRAEAMTDAERAALAVSEELLAELNAADLLVIGAPMYNFGISSTLKSWFDYILRAGITFRYTESGPEGLITGKKAVVIETRGGLYSEGPAASLDSQEPHLRTMLGFMGVTELVFVRAEKLGYGPDAAAAAIEAAIAELGDFADTELALAA